MRRLTSWALVILIASAAQGTTLRAHHGYTAFFDPAERTVAIDGDLVNLVYANPHIVMTIRAGNDALYTVTWQAMTWAERNAGVTKDTFKVGDHLVVVGAPSRDPSARQVTMLREVRRPRDGWIWRSNAPYAQPS
jgi:hypothetical protein